MGKQQCTHKYTRVLEANELTERVDACSAAFLARSAKLEPHMVNPSLLSWKLKPRKGCGGSAAEQQQ